MHFSAHHKLWRDHYRVVRRKARNIFCSWCCLYNLLYLSVCWFQWERGRWGCWWSGYSEHRTLELRWKTTWWSPVSIKIKCRFLVGCHVTGRNSPVPPPENPLFMEGALSVRLFWSPPVCDRTQHGLRKKSLGPAHLQNTFSHHRSTTYMSRLMFIMPQ